MLGRKGIGDLVYACLMKGCWEEALGWRIDVLRSGGSISKLMFPSWVSTGRVGDLLEAKLPGQPSKLKEKYGRVD